MGDRLPKPKGPLVDRYRGVKLDDMTREELIVVITLEAERDRRQRDQELRRGQEFIDTHGVGGPEGRRHWQK